MKKRAFEVYMASFESEVLCELHALAILKMIPVRPGKLAKTRFASLMGSTFNYIPSLVIDYYGLLKRSTGLVEKILEMKRKIQGKQLRLIKVPVIHFASVRMEDVAASAPELVAALPEFKKTILSARGFES